MVGGRGNGERRPAGPLLAAAVVVVGLLTTALAAAGLHAAQQDKADRVMDQRHEMALAAVETEIGRYRFLLETLAAGASSQTTLTWDDFDIASAPLEGARLIGAAALAFVVPVRTADLAVAQQQWRRLGSSGLVLRPSPGRDEHFFTVYSRILNDYDVAGVHGTDLAAAPQLTGALTEARRIRQTAVSDAYVLLRDRNKPAAQQQQSFVFAAPVWTRANQPEFRGWAVLGLRGRNFLSGILGTASQGHLFGTLSMQNSDGSRVTLADWSVPGKPDLVRTSDFQVGDRSWTLKTEADSARLPGAGGHPAVIALTGGSLLTMLLAWLVYVLATGRSRARAQVEVATEELRQAEAGSRHQAGLLGAVLSSISDGVVVVDEHGTVLLHNPAGRRLQGVTEDAAEPSAWQEHYGAYRPDGRTPMPMEEMPLIRALRGEPSDGVEVFLRNPGRPEGVLLSIDGRPLDLSAGHRGAVAVFRDITELRRYETDLTIFAGVVAHDLKAPLSVARGHAELALDDLADEPAAVAGARDSVLRVVRAVDRMDTLIETLLAYTTARHAPLRLGPVELEPLVREVIESRITHAGGDGRPVPQWSVGPLPAVQADRDMLRHVLDNLIGNAIKYVRPGAVPRVEVTGAAEEPDRVRIEVADAGIGIPDGDKPYVFESFHRTAEAAGYAGTGLGLAICRRIVERHGGAIGVTDNPGGGTRFHFTLPAATADTEVTVEINDDDQAVREALDRALAERAAILEAAHLPGLGVPPVDPGADRGRDPDRERSGKQRSDQRQ